MKNNIISKELSIGLIILFVISSCIPAFGAEIKNTSFEKQISNESDIKYLDLEFDFSEPEIVEYNGYIIVRVEETDLNWINEGKPILPVNLTTLEFEFGTKILNIDFEHTPPVIYDLSKKLAFGGPAVPDNMRSHQIKSTMDLSIYDNSDPYPDDWISNYTGGGLSFEEHTSFLVLRVYPVRYFPNEDQLHFIEHITINITYVEPSEPLIDDNDECDLLILTPLKFKSSLIPLKLHKNRQGIKTKVVGLNQVYLNMVGQGRDKQEKIKLFIKDAVENWGIKYVLLVGGLRSQSCQWYLPVRYSHVVPYEEQEYAEQSFISDVYYADIYDSEGGFSSWDTNGNNIFAEWHNEGKDDMDVYPDVYLGRLPCRNLAEVNIMVNKIRRYEKSRLNKDWFNNLVTVAGDSYNDSCHFNEGELISQKAIDLMPGFTPVNVWASEQDINRKTVNDAMNPGCGFAYFCGHGSPMSWSTHFPPNGTEWTTGYDLKDMIYLKNGYKLPVTIVGGCHNAQFDVTMMNIIKGILKDGLQYFSTKPGNIGQFWHNEWVPNSWAWYLTSKIGGGAIATIANTGLGTHGDGDWDNNSVADYLEVLDGWLELRILQLYAEENAYMLGENHGEALTGYLHRFLGNGDKMDVKMVQQWALFGDSSLKIGGYN